MTQQLTYLYKMIFAQSRINTQRYQKGCACGEDTVFTFYMRNKKDAGMS